MLSTELKKNNISFQEISLYETVIEERKKEELLRQLSKMDYVTFGSSSAVKAFVTMTKDYDGIMPKLVSIGPITTASMQEYGLNVTKRQKYIPQRECVTQSWRSRRNVEKILSCARIYDAESRFL